jgi:hypothetical protein
MPEEKVLTPAYVPFKTFTAVLDSFSSFLPDQLHPTMWPSYSGGIKSQLLGALRFLRLVDDRDRPTDALKGLADADSQHRPQMFKDVLKTAYPALMSVDLTRATPGSFDAEMRKFGQEGETHRKASSFFLQAAKWAGVPLSPLLVKKGSLSGSRRKRIGISASATKAKSKPVVIPHMSGAADPEYINTNGGSKREIVLSGGSRMFLSTDTDLFRMASEDRKFVMKLLDLMEEYETNNDTSDLDDDEPDDVD